MTPRTGKGRSIAQHGELFQGQIEDAANRRRCLLSLPCKALYSEATFLPDLTGVVTVRPAHKTKAKKVVKLTLEYLNAPELGGTITLHSTVPEAKGYGSSTADCVAAAISAADAIEHSLSQKELARLVVQAELASDNFMFHHAVLFAHREGVVLEDYAQDVPKLEVVGIDTAKNDHVDTLKYPPAAYSWRQIESFRVLTSALRRAVQRGDLRLLGRVATASALINECFLPKPKFKEIRRIADMVGALGISVAHSGTVLSVLFDPKDGQLGKKIDQLLGELSQLGTFNFLRFQT
jgi:uncharacterized protein involved in propanediol utilization